MTIEQMAIATRSDPTWLHNARRLLGRKLHCTPNGARWWGLVRVLNHELGVALDSAARAADAVLATGLEPNRVRLAACLDGSVALQIDLARFHSTANALLASAFAFAPAKRRGRPPKLPPLAPGDAASTASRVRVEDTPERLELLAEQLRKSGARPRGIESGLPFIMDVATLRAVSRLALTTRDGDVDIIVSSAGTKE